MSEIKKEPTLERSSPESGGQLENETVAAVQDGNVVNASGYKDQLKRQYGLVGLAGVALTVDNAWIALGSSLSVSIGMSCALKSAAIPRPWRKENFQMFSTSRNITAMTSTTFPPESLVADILMQLMVVPLVLSSALSWPSFTTPSLV